VQFWAIHEKVFGWLDIAFLNYLGILERILAVQLSDLQPKDFGQLATTHIGCVYAEAIDFPLEPEYNSIIKDCAACFEVVPVQL